MSRLNNLDVKDFSLKKNPYFRIEFNNSAYTNYLETMHKLNIVSYPLVADKIFEIFPFSVLFDEELNICMIGYALRQLIPKCIGKPFVDYLKLIRPLVEFKWATLLNRTNVIFEFELEVSASKTGRLSNIKLKTFDAEMEDSTLTLRGINIYVLIS